MAFSLEAALVVPLVIGTWLGFAQTALPAYVDVRQSTRLEVRALKDANRRDRLYHVQTIGIGSRWTMCLITSPQNLIEIVDLIVDDGRLLLSSFSGQSGERVAEP